MNYLILNGSPRKGNTWLLAEQIQKEIMALSPEAVFEELHLKDMDLPFCRGCSQCFRKGHEFCPHTTIVQSVIDKIDWADGVIFATTTFLTQPTALTKNLIDHLAFLGHRPCFFTKKAIVVSTVGGVGAKKTVKYLAGALRSFGFNKCYEFPVASYSWNHYIPSPKDKEKCRKLAHIFHKDVSSKKLHAPNLLPLIPYNMIRGLSLDYVKGTEFETLDGDHWTDLSRAKCAYDPAVPLPLYKKLFGNLFYVLAKRLSKRTTVTYKKGKEA
ncbi:MAG: NAD(P)H-dependent oxidoreductase [Peptococcaceae bacterium]|nr:NAD(P)H-dependent oxidoreductase [Peptococcaceae bacterium]